MIDRGDVTAHPPKQTIVINVERLEMLYCSHLHRDNGFLGKKWFLTKNWHL